MVIIMDVLIIYEHIEREIYNAFLLKFELEKRGYTVSISRYQEPTLPSFNAPKLIIMPWLFAEHNLVDLRARSIRPFYKILNMQYEQVMSQMWLDVGYYIPKDKARNAVQLCWGHRRKQLLIDEGFSENQLITIGDIRQDFSKEAFKDFFKTKKQLSQEFNIPEDHEWNLFISSFSFANPSDEFKKELDEKLGVEYSDKWQKICFESQKEILMWIEQFVSENPAHEFIYRPHPSEVKDSDYSYLEKLKNKYSNFHFIFQYSVQDWILASDFVNTWISTSIIESYVLDKVCNILRPVHVDEYLDIPLYIDAKYICDYDSFSEKNLSKDNDEFPVSFDMIKSYYDSIDDGNFVYKKICDYVEEIIKNDSYNGNFYNYGPILDNLKFLIGKITNGRIFAIFNNFFNNKKNNELAHVESIDYDKLKILKKIVEDNFD